MLISFAQVSDKGAGETVSETVGQQLCNSFTRRNWHFFLGAESAVAERRRSGVRNKKGKVLDYK